MKAIAVGIMAALLAASAQTEEAARRLKVARNAELVDGDLHAAIKQYSAIVVKYVKTDRGVTAMALVHMAECYQKLGDGESHKLYEQVLREYADQKDAAAMARAKLGRTQVVAGTGMSNRRLWTLPLKGDLSGTVSRDGRYVSYVDSGLYGDLFVHDLLTGADRRVTNTGTDGKPGVVRQYAEDSTFSRDGNQLVYTWHRGDDHHELRVVDLKGNGIPQFHRLFDIEDIHWISPDDWSPDGKWLAVRVERKDNTTQIGLVSVQDGSLRVLKSVDGHGSSRMWFSPDGKYLGYDLPESDSSPLLDVFVLAIDGTREIPAVVHRSHDLMTGWSPDGKWLLFTSDRTGSMGLWGLPFAEGKLQGAPELIKADIGRLDSIGITNSGALYSQVFKPSVTRSIQIVDFDFATGTLLSTSDLTQDFESNFSPSWSPDGKYLAYVSMRDWTGPANTAKRVVVIRSAETRQVVRELRVKLSYFNGVSWARDGRSFSTRGADFKGRWGIYQVEAQTGDMSPLRLDQPGESLTPFATWSRDGKSIYFVRRLSGGKEFALVQWDLASGNEREVIRRASVGVPNVSPDGRYMATPSVNPSTNSNVMLLIPTAGGEAREVMKVPAGQGWVGGVIWAPDSRSILTWKSRPADEKRNKEVWRIPIGGDEPRKLDVKLGAPAGGKSEHPDGRQIAISVEASETSATQPPELWVLENFLPVTSAKK